MRSLVLPGVTGANAASPAYRLVAFAVIAVGEILLASLLFPFAVELPEWQNPVAYASHAAQVAFLAAPIFAIVAWPRRRELFDAWTSATADVRWTWYLLANAGIFLVLLAAKWALAQLAEPPAYGLAAYIALLLATGASLACLLAPIGFWRSLSRLAPIEIAVAAIGAVIMLGAGRLAREGWTTLSDATLVVSHWLLTLYESDVVMNSGEKLLGVGDFAVKIYRPCSGYEGAALVIGFLSLYLWVFRKTLRFPHALLLLPIGITAIWFLNAVRIATLVSIGAHVSPAVAVEGFHSQGGWIGFLLVTLAMMAVSQKIAFFAARPAGRTRAVAAADVAAPKSGARVSVEYLAPFMALMATGIVMSAAAPHDQWLNILKVIAVGGVLWWFRDAYAKLLWPVSPLAIVVGLAVGLVWIATDPGRTAEAPLAAWLAALPVWLCILWLTIRGLVSVVLVPVAEELAFRGYLHRALISARFEEVSFGQFRWLALIGSSVAFGLLHERWLAAFLAGAVYALLMYRTKRLSDPIAAHVASNAAIMLWVVAMEEWALI